MLRNPKNSLTTNISISVEMKDGHCWDSLDIVDRSLFSNGFLVCMKPGDERIMMIPTMDIAYMFVVHGDTV